mmetsp:Transcript_5354/g.14382  ORF Transcript_5354/g.14382 Transcript_5354/m.14382 type:complete len:209 (+) Transcript_5354:319-945(+)
MPSPSASTSLRRRLISLRVSPSSADFRHLANSLRSSAPDPSESAELNTVNIICSSCSRGMPWRRCISTASRASTSSSSAAALASSLAFMLWMSSTMMGTNSRYSRTPSSFSSASDIIRLTSLVLRPRSVLVSSVLNSWRSRYPSWSSSYSMNRSMMKSWSSSSPMFHHPACAEAPASSSSAATSGSSTRSAARLFSSMRSSKYLAPYS